MSDNSRNALAGSIVGLISLLAVAAFLIIGFTYHIWHPTWMVFLAIPIASVLTDIAIKRSAVSAVSSLVSLLATAAFLYLGFEYGKWHPGWLVFFSIPICSLLMKILTRPRYVDASDSNNSGNTSSSGNANNNCGGNGCGCGSNGNGTDTNQNG